MQDFYNSTYKYNSDSYKGDERKQKTWSSRVLTPNPLAILGQDMVFEPH